MARLPIEILDLSRRNARLLSQTVTLINERQDQFLFSVLDEAKAFDLHFAVRNDTEINKFIPSLNQRKAEWRGYHPFLLCFFDSAISLGNDRNLFSVDLAQRGFAAITTHNVLDILIPPDKIAAYVVFQLAFFALKFSGGDIDFHEEDRGCIFDYREKKIGIVKCISAPHICDDCKTKLQENGGCVSPTQLSSVYAMLETASELIAEQKKAEPIRRKKIFIGSSVEGLGIARAIQSELDHEYSVEVWNQSEVFGLGTATLEALEEAVKSYDFGIFVFTPDDQITMRDKLAPVVRDNVIFETGLFVGKLGRYRSFVVRPRKLSMQIPTDLNGIIVADYDPAQLNLAAAVGAPCTKIRSAIGKV
jgi:predicted nucleotide-binding protein